MRLATSSGRIKQRLVQTSAEVACGCRGICLMESHFLWNLFFAPVGSFFWLGGVSSAFVLLRFLTSEHELSLSASALLLFHLSAFYRCLLLVFPVFLLLLLLFCFSAFLLCFSACPLLCCNALLSCFFPLCILFAFCSFLLMLLLFLILILVVLVIRVPL